MEETGEPLKDKDIGDLGSSGYELLKLDNQLCFALYAATRAITKTYRQKLSAMGLTYPQYLVLLVLWDRDDITITDIGARLRLDSGTLTPLLKRLDAMGIVRRQRGGSDAREVHIHLTAKGRDLMDAALEARRHVACQLGMTEPQIMELRADLMEMIDQLESAAEPVEA